MCTFFFFMAVWKISGRWEWCLFGFCFGFSICFYFFFWLYAMYGYTSWPCRPPHSFFFSTLWAYLAAFSLAAHPTPANKTPSSSPRWLLLSFLNSQCNVSLPDNTYPTKTLPKASILPHEVILSLGLSSLSYWTCIFITTCQGTCVSSLIRLLQPVLFLVYSMIRDSFEH